MVPQGTLCSREGGPALTRRSVPTAAETGLGQDHHIRELPGPLSEARPSYKSPVFTFPGNCGHSLSHISHSRARARAHLTRTARKVAGSGLCGGTGIAAGPRSLLVAAAAAPAAGRPGAPLLLGFVVWVEVRGRDECTQPAGDTVVNWQKAPLDPGPVHGARSDSSPTWPLSSIPCAVNRLRKWVKRPYGVRTNGSRRPRALSV